MKIPNKQELQQIAFNDSSDIELKDFINLYNICTARPYSFVVIHPTLASDNPPHFRKNLLERIWKLIMTTDYKTRDEKVEYDINREAAKILALPLGKINIFEYLTGDEILPSDQRRVIEQAKFTYSSLGTALQNAKKNNWRSTKKTSWNLKSFKAIKRYKIFKTRRKSRPWIN